MSLEIFPTLLKIRPEQIDLTLPTVADLLQGNYVGPVAYVQGYSSPYDGGEGFFYLDPSDTTTPHNGGTVLVDSKGRRWKRVPKGPVDIRWFGCVPGTDCTNSFLAAVEAAKTQGSPLYIPEGTYIVSPSETVDITGIPLIYGFGTLDLSGATAFPIFKASGTWELIHQGSLSAGQTSIPSSIPLQPGDVLYIISTEPSPNPARSYYYKGGVHVVQSYDSNSNTATIGEPVWFDFSQAYVFVGHLIHVAIRDVFFIGASGGAQRLIELHLAKVSISGVKARGFGERAISVARSIAFINDCHIEDTYYSNTGTSYGIAISDMSIVAVSNCHISVNRHAIAAGGGTVDLSEIGGSGSGAYPSVVTITGGHYESKVHGTLKVNAIDAHGIAYSITVSGCRVIGGFSISANYNVVTGCEIDFSDSIGVYSGSDSASQEWGTYLISGNVFVQKTPKGSAIRLSGLGFRDATITGNHILAQWNSNSGYTYPLLYVLAPHKRLQIANNIMHNSGTTCRNQIDTSGQLVIQGNVIINQELLIRAKGGGEVIFSENRVEISNGSYDAVRITYSTLPGFKSVVVNGNRVSGSPQGGIYIDTVDNATLVGNVISDCGIYGFILYNIPQAIRAANLFQNVPTKYYTNNVTFVTDP